VKEDASGEAIGGGTRGDGEEDRQGNEERGDSTPLVHPLPLSAAPVYEWGCAHPICRPVLSLSLPLVVPFIIITYIICIRTQYNLFFFVFMKIGTVQLDSR
jgi:hypothetical protein